MHYSYYELLANELMDTNHAKACQKMAHTALDKVVGGLRFLLLAMPANEHRERVLTALEDYAIHLALTQP